MDYFLIRTHPEYIDAPRLSDFHEKLDTNHFYRNQSYNMPSRTIIKVYPNEHMDFTDYLFQSVPLFSERAMKLIWQFDDDFVHKQIILLSPVDKKDSLYYLPFFPRFPAGTIKTPLLSYGSCNWDNCGEIVLHVPYLLPVFMVFPNQKCLLFMRLDVVETLLSNLCRGLLINKADVIAHTGS